MGGGIGGVETKRSSEEIDGYYADDEEEEEEEEEEEDLGSAFMRTVMGPTGKRRAGQDGR